MNNHLYAPGYSVVLEIKILRLWISWIIRGIFLGEKMAYDCESWFEDAFVCHISEKYSGFDIILLQWYSFSFSWTLST